MTSLNKGSIKEAMRSRSSYESGLTNNTPCQSFALASRNDPGAVILNSRRERPVRSFDEEGTESVPLHELIFQVALEVGPIQALPPPELSDSRGHPAHEKRKRPDPERYSIGSSHRSCLRDSVPGHHPGWDVRLREAQGATFDTENTVGTMPSIVIVNKIRAMSPHTPVLDDDCGPALALLVAGGGREFDRYGRSRAVDLSHADVRTRCPDAVRDAPTAPTDPGPRR
jgi:hypothetical protein